MMNSLAQTATASAGSHAEISPETRRSLRVLLVEDDPLSRAMITEQLSDLGAAVECVDTGPAALSAWQLDPHDVVLLSCDSPSLEAPEIARLLRRMESEGLRASRGPCLVVALAAELTPKTRKEMMSSGMTACLTRPLDSQRLVGTLFSDSNESALARKPLEQFSSRASVEAHWTADAYALLPG